MLITTRTIVGSFLRKYAALSGLNVQLLRQIFEFKPVRVNVPMTIRGCVFEFFYSLHSIPCIGFKATFAGKSISFSADHCNDPALINKLHAQGVVSDHRRDELLVCICVTQHPSAQ